MWNIRDALTREPLKCKANPSLASPNRVHGDRIQFWTTDDLHGETPFDDAELGEGCVQDEDTQGFGLIVVEAGYFDAWCCCVGLAPMLSGCWRARRTAFGILLGNEGTRRGNQALSPVSRL